MARAATSPLGPNPIKFCSSVISAARVNLERTETSGSDSEALSGDEGSRDGKCGSGLEFCLIRTGSGWSEMSVSSAISGKSRVLVKYG